jgi:AcrR family transcriptional regulator
MDRRKPAVHERPGSHIADHPKSRRIPDDIFEAALRVFEQQSVAETTVEDIARTANIAKGTFFNYFKSKDEFLAQMTRNGLERLCDEVRRKVNPKSSPTHKIRQIVEAHLDFYLARPGYLAMMQQVGNTWLRPRTHDPLSGEFQRYVQFLSHLIGKTNGTPPRGVAAIFAGMVTGSLSYLLSLRSPKELSAWRAYVHDRITNMILPRQH